AAGGMDGLISVFDITAAGPGVTIPVSDNKILAMAWSPDDALLGASGTEPVIRIIDPSTPKVVTTLFGHEARVDMLAWGAGGLVSCARDWTMRWWGTGGAGGAEGLAPTSRHFNRGIGSGCFDPLGRFFYVAQYSGVVLALDPSDLHTVFEVDTGGSPI